MEAGRRRWAGDTARAANTDEVKNLRREACKLKEIVADQTLELHLRMGKVGIGKMSNLDRLSQTSH
jgi:transposase